MRSTVATANGSFLANEKDSIAASVSEVSIPDARVEYFLDFKSCRAAFARLPILEDRVLPRCWSSRSTISRITTRTGPLMRSRSSSSISLLCSSITRMKLVSRRTVRDRPVFTCLFRSMAIVSQSWIIGTRSCHICRSVESLGQRDLGRRLLYRVDRILDPSPSIARTTPATIETAPQSSSICPMLRVAPSPSGQGIPCTLQA